MAILMHLKKKLPPISEHNCLFTEAAIYVIFPDCEKKKVLKKELPIQFRCILYEFVSSFFCLSLNIVA